MKIVAIKCSDLDVAIFISSISLQEALIYFVIH